jgi:hypothetical protein
METGGLLRRKNVFVTVALVGSGLSALSAGDA